MCGIAGFWDSFHKFPVHEQLAQDMAHQIQERGPDSFGVWIDEQKTVALAHRRLAILDLSPAGHQPMTSASGRYVMVYNGEIFNSDELK